MIYKRTGDWSWWRGLGQPLSSCSVAGGRLRDIGGGGGATSREAPDNWVIVCGGAFVGLEVGFFVEICGGNHRE